MPEKPDDPCGAEQWALFRFGVVGRLLAAPPKRGELGAALDQLAQQPWRHPRTGQWVRVGRSTLERWYYRAAGSPLDPMRALARRVRCDRARSRAMSPALLEVLRGQYEKNASWSCRLHADNLALEVESHPELGPMPSYRCLLRAMKSHGMFKRKRLGPAASPGARQAERRLEQREVRSYESEFTNALWHLDFHHGSLRVLLSNGKWAWPILLGILDDHSRLCCHVQWYLAETAENLVHGLSQAILKYGLPRALMSDNGSPMLAAETTQGLERLAVVHEKTLPYSPYQNGKQESFWGRVEGRLLAMLRNAEGLSLAKLNEATLAWAEVEYNRSVHSQLGQTPLHSFVHDKDVARPAPTADRLRMAFTQRASRIQRRTDGTISVLGKRFEIPAAFRHFHRIHLRMASWDLSDLRMCDPATGEPIARLYPLDKHKNANARRRTRTPESGQTPARPDPPHRDELPPLMRKLLAEYAATGLPPAYIPKDDTEGASGAAPGKEQ